MKEPLIAIRSFTYTTTENEIDDGDPPLLWCFENRR